MHRFPLGLLLAGSALTALPCSAAEPIKVQVNVTIVEMPASMVVPFTTQPGYLCFTALTKEQENVWIAAVQTGREAGKVKVVAEPRIITLSGRKAKVISGGQVAIPSLETKNGIDQVKVDFRDVGFEAEMLPIVRAGGEIYLEAVVRHRSINQGLGTHTNLGFIPGFDEDSTTTACVLKPGQPFLVCPNCDDTAPTNMAHVFYMVPTIVEDKPTKPAPLPATIRDPARVVKVVASLVAQYQKAAERGDRALAADLAKMALDLDPLCFLSAIKEPEEPKTCPCLRLLQRLFPHTSTGSMTLPSGKYLEHRPQYFPADPDFPLAKELESLRQLSPPMPVPSK